MRVVLVIPGSGTAFYCQNCLRDSVLAQALRQAGVDVMVAPMYLPLFEHDPALDTGAPVFYGAVNLYLRGKFPWLRHAPGWLQRRLDSPALLAWAARRAGSTSARGLEGLTLSVLRGPAGDQAAELGALLDWLARTEKPDVIHLSNALLLGLAPGIKRRLDVPVVCSLQDEDGWVDAMREPQATAVWNAMAEQAAHVDAFIAVSRYFAERLRGRLRLPAARLHVVYPGVDVASYPPAALTLQPPVIGYLSRLTESLGLDVLVEAFIRLKVQPEFRDLRLRATGGSVGRGDRRCRRRLDAAIERAGCAAAVAFLPDFTGPARREFLRSLSVMSVPVPNGEAFGLYQLEALAAGVPLVQPRVGAFPELLEATGGGILYAPNDAEHLAAALAELLRDPERLRACGRQGRAAVTERFQLRDLARQVLAVYAGCRPAPG